jgi:hypothetical protein
MLAIIWNNLNWFGFNAVFGIFKYLAPFSYVIYISHYYLVVEATYLNFINNKIIEYVLYIIMFAFLIEVVVYTKIKNSVMVVFLINLKNNVMKIGIEGQRRKHGMDMVALELIKNLQDLDHENEYFFVNQMKIDQPRRRS